MAQQKAHRPTRSAAGGAKMKFANADKDAQRQASQVDCFVSQGVSAIVAIPWDIEAAVNLAETVDRGRRAVHLDGPGARPT